jgi:hypothetical protein
VSGYYDRTGKYHRPGSTSRSGGWWTYAAPRPSNAIGISPELPTGRAVAWNVMFVAVEVIGAAAAHVAFGVSWWQLAAGLAAVLVLGGALLAYVVLIGTPRALRRRQALLRAHLANPRPRPDDETSAGTSATRATTTNTTGTGRAA